MSLNYDLTACDHDAIYDGDEWQPFVQPIIFATMLSAYERWMVRCNLQDIAVGETTRAERVALLRANGYDRVADAVEHPSGSFR